MRRTSPTWRPTPSLVRRIVAGSKEELPESGENCNGGVYYYVPLRDALPVAIFTARGGGAKSGGQMEVNGRVVSLPSGELSEEAAAQRLSEALREAFPAAELTAEGGSVVMVADVEYWQVSGLAEEEWELTLHVRMAKSGYEVYAWLESADGEGSWASIGEAYDIATQEVYGMTKLGTDAPVLNGTPVGVNERGEMNVPRAEWLMPGGVLPGQDGEVSGGAGVGFDAEGRMRVRAADGGNYGVVKTSFGGAADAPVVGKMADGRLGVPWSTREQGGVVRLGSAFGQKNPTPYNQGVGADENHRLVNNLLYQGAWKHMSPKAWAALGMPWLTQVMEENPEWFTDAYYGGLHTSVQFTQSAENGLELLPATTSMVGGVQLAISLSGEAGDGEVVVPTAKVILDYLQANYTPSTTMETKYLGKTEAADVYLTKKDAGGTYVTQEAAKDFVRKTKQWTGNVYLSEAEYNALKKIDPLVEYNILGNSH